MPTTFLMRQAAIAAQRPHHDVERIGDADDEGVGCIFADPGADLAHHLQIDFQQVVAAHAGLARHPGGHDHHVGAGDRLVLVGAGEAGIEAFDRAALGNIERLALRQPLDDVEQHHVAQFLEPCEVSQRAPDHAAADQSNLAASHKVPTEISLSGARRRL
jgi:hypothetical protein